MYIVVAYDISDNARRFRISRHLEGYGLRVQYSVFECELEEKHLRRLVSELERMMEPGDGLRIYRMPRPEADVLILGGPPRVKLHRTTII